MRLNRAQIVQLGQWCQSNRAAIVSCAETYAQLAKRAGVELGYDVAEPVLYHMVKSLEIPRPKRVAIVNGGDLSARVEALEKIVARLVARVAIDAEEEAALRGNGPRQTALAGIQ